MTRSVDYSSMEPRQRQLLASAFFSCFRKPTPRDQLSAAIGLVVGLAGFDLRIDPHLVSAADRVRIDELLNEAADAVLDVLAADGAMLRPVGK